MGHSLSYLDNVLPGYIPECIASFHVHGNLFTAAGSVFFFSENRKKKDYFCHDTKYKVENV